MLGLLYFNHQFKNDRLRKILVFNFRLKVLRFVYSIKLTKINLLFKKWKFTTTISNGVI